MNSIEERQAILETRIGPTTRSSPSLKDDAIYNLTVRIENLERENSRLRSALDRIVDGAPTHGDTLAKAAARHDLLISLMNFQEVGKARWFCSDFICFREKSVCAAVQERSAEPGKKAEECIARNVAFCRGIGKPLFGAASHGKKDLAQLMTCHIGIDTCRGWAAKHGGDCVGVE